MRRFAFYTLLLTSGVRGGVLLAFVAAALFVANDEFEEPRDVNIMSCTFYATSDVILLFRDISLLATMAVKFASRSALRG